MVPSLFEIPSNRATTTEKSANQPASPKRNDAMLMHFHVTRGQMYMDLNVVYAAIDSKQIGNLTSK